MTPTFETREQAEEWMIDEIDDECIDNFRFAFDDDYEAGIQYETAQYNGCCGSFDARVTVNGRPAHIGCNYGH